MMDCVGHYSRPDLLQLQMNPSAWSVMTLPTDSETEPVLPEDKRPFLSLANPQTDEQTAIDCRTPIPRVKTG